MLDHSPPIPDPTPVTPPSAVEGVHWYDWSHVSDLIITWAPILFMGLLVFVLWRTMKMMPRTKPQEIRPESKWAIGWDDVAGADDLHRVSDISRSMVHEYAMGTVSYTHLTLPTN